MKAVIYRKSLPTDDPTSLENADVPAPSPKERDLLVRVKAISVNPVDTKVRRFTEPAADELKILGWDAVGVVEKIGSAVKNFKIGDRVYYAGAIDRAGANSELHAVDERIVALAPKSLTDTDAAALPLTTLTAYELLFDRLGVPKGGGDGKKLLIIGGAGGVGSVLIQLARQLTKLQVIATASRAETRQWCLDLGAHAVIDHSKPLSEELTTGGFGQVDIAVVLTQSKLHFPEILLSLKPQGKLGAIDDLAGIDATQLREKSISLHQELMYTRSLFQTEDMDEQGKLLAEVAALVDAGRVRTTAKAHYGTINAENLRKAHALLESGKALGKVVLEGF